MANINSNVITLKRSKQQLTLQTDTTTQTRIFTINVKNEDNLSLKFKGNVNLSSAGRIIKVLGCKNIADAGIGMSGISELGFEVDFTSYSVLNEEQEFGFDVTAFDFVKVSVQNSVGYWIETSVSNKKIIPAYSATINNLHVGTLTTLIKKISTKGKKYLRVWLHKADNSAEGSARVDLKCFDHFGVEITKTLFDAQSNNYSSNRAFASTGSRHSDSYIDIRDVDYFYFISGFGEAKVYYSLFDSVEEEYTRIPLKTTFALRGFDWVKIRFNTLQNAMNVRDLATSELASCYNVAGIFQGLFNVRVLTGKDYYYNVSKIDVVAGSAAIQSIQPIFNYSPSSRASFFDNGTVKVEQLNELAPIAQYRNYKAFLNPLTNELRLTDTGADYYNAEYRKLLSEINPSTLVNAVFIPYKPIPTAYTEAVRFCIEFTDGGLYHNFPNRATNGQGTSLEGDIIQFDKSVLWDLDDRFPSTSSSAVAPYYYDPTLQADNYDVFVPLNEANIFGNGGFPLVHPSINRIRVRKNGYKNILNGLNSLEIGRMYTVNDTYNHPTKNGIFETMDGGRQWFLQADIANVRITEKHYGNIDTTALGAYSGTVILKKVVINAPTAVIPAPTQKFSITDVGNIIDIAVGPNPNITINAHNLAVNDRIILAGASSSHAVMLNNEHTVNSNGNKQVYKVSEVINANTIRIRPMSTDSNSPIECHHVHSVNQVYDGWVMSTGEEHPCGWVLYVQNIISDYVATPNSQVRRTYYRLNSSVNSALRAVGFVMLADDDENPTCIYAGDSPNIPMPKMKVGNREIVSRSSLGLRVGKLVDLDDVTKFKTVVPFSSGMLGLKQHNSIIYAVGGYDGSYAISVDMGKTWVKHAWGRMILRKPIGFTERQEMLLTGGFIISSK